MDITVTANLVVGGQEGVMHVYFVNHAAPSYCNINAEDLWVLYQVVRQGRGDIRLDMTIGGRLLRVPIDSIDAERTFGDLIREAYQSVPPAA